MKKYTIARILMESGKSFNEFKQNILNKDKTTMLFRLELAACNTEKEVKELVERYI